MSNVDVEFRDDDPEDAWQPEDNPAEHFEILDRLAAQITEIIVDPNHHRAREVARLIWARDQINGLPDLPAREALRHRIASLLILEGV